MAESFLVNARQFKFEMVAPEKVEITAQEERVMLPGEEGDFTVMAGHTQLLAGLRPGVVSVYHSNHVVRYFISGGFADIGNQHCTVLTPHVTPVTRLVADRLERDIQYHEDNLATLTETTEIDRLKAELVIMHAKLEAAQKYNA